MQRLRVIMLATLACSSFVYSSEGYSAYILEEEIDYTVLNAPRKEEFNDSLRKTLVLKDDENLFKGVDRTRDFMLAPTHDNTSDCDKVKRFLFKNISSRKQVDYLEGLFPDILDSKQDWRSLSEVVDRMYRTYPTQTEKFLRSPEFQKEVATYFSSPEFYSDLEHAVNGIDAITRDGDTVVAVGNTPQFIRTALEFSRNNINTIPVAISSWPGKVKDVFDGVHSKLQNHVTPEGQLHYRQYLEKLGITPEKLPSGRIFLLDYVSSGGGIEFLIQQIHQMYKTAGKPQPDINIISISGQLKEKKNLRSIKVDSYPLKLSKLADCLDTVGESSDYVANPFRVLPNFPAWKWHSWHDDPTKTKPGAKAIEIMQGIRRHFASRHSEYDPLESDRYRAEPFPVEKVTTPVKKRETLRQYVIIN